MIQLLVAWLDTLPWEDRVPLPDLPWDKQKRLGEIAPARTSSTDEETRELEEAYAIYQADSLPNHRPKIQFYLDMALPHVNTADLADKARNQH